MTIGIFILCAMIALIMLGVPVAFAIGVASMGAIVMGNYELIIIPQKVLAGLDSFPILSIPFFVLAGDLMTSGGLNDRIMKFSSAVAGWVQGSLGIITIVASAIFSAISGSGTASVCAIGGITIPAMKKEGYTKEFAAAINGSAAILGPLIPPSIILIVYGNAVQASITDLFLASVTPGIIMTVTFILYIIYKAKKLNLPVGEKFNAKQVAVETKNGFWALLMPIIILGGIFGGIFTATEAAAVSAVYAFIVGWFVYKNLNIKNLQDVLLNSSITSATLLFVLAASKVSSWALAVAKVPEGISNGILSVSDNPIILLLIINLFLFLVGMFMEANVAVVIFTPILLPLALSCGLTAVQFGVIMCINLCIGLITPPVGLCVLLANTMAEGKLEKTLIDTLPFILVACITLFLSTYLPESMTWILR